MIMVFAAIASALLIGFVLGVDVADRRLRRRADSYVNRARTRLVLAEQLEERAALLLADVRAHHDVAQASRVRWS
jgi:hypothetical protein